MRKHILTLLLCCSVICVSNVQAFAAEPINTVTNVGTFEISPQMDYIVQAKGNLYINSSGVATVTSSVYGYQGTTTRVEISAKLQQYNGGKWVTLKTYTASSDSHRTSLSESYKISKGYSYRMQATIKAYSGSKSETQTVTSSEANY